MAWEGTVPHHTGYYGLGPGSVNREDLMDMISIIDPWETPFFVATPKVEANSVTVEWLTDTLATSSTVGACEGADFGAAADTPAALTRNTNICQIFRKDFKVSNTMRAVNPAGANDWYAYQVQKHLKEVARDVEITTLNISAASAAGGSAVSRVMKPYTTMVTTNVHNLASTTKGWGDGYDGAAGSATVMTEDRFNNMLEEIFNSGGNPDTAYVNMTVKRAISDFSGMGSSRRNIAMAEKKLIASVDVYDSDAGMISIVADRWVHKGHNTATDHTDATGDAHFVETGMNQYAILRPIRHVPLNPAGDAAIGMIVGELTIKVINEKAQGRFWQCWDHVKT